MKSLIPKEYVELYCKKFKVENTSFFTDKIAIIELIEKYNIKSIFEIGTWKGEMSLLMYLHPQVKHLKTIDINKNMGIPFSDKDNNPIHPLSNPEVYGDMLKYTNCSFEFCDCRKYPLKENEYYDMVFIDGSKEIEYVINDIHLALKFNPKIIVWHDYYEHEKRTWNTIKKLREENIIKNPVYQIPNSIIGFTEVNIGDKNEES